ncbi:SdpI family protein [Microlunatus sp. Gsoil 973]|jgi:hypothetical protein|uniref:SdpI family protein n=1 Tax=Microlunatus sp. Gsoil 973 TaxID=2672569 RepID=UPI0012B4AA97|nr:SdpI family protein [Microlunatus sp. Gsoil 973]QGN33719.1 hypothetical protein GJV80_13870 [Microlunatus sp. Gsoil 973]
MNNGPGLGPAILVAALITVALAGLAGVSRMLAGGTIGPNPLVGIRLPALLASERAWQGGHRAAVRPLTITALVAFLALVGSVVAAGTVLWYLIFLCTALAFVIIGVVVAAVVAVRAARRV